MRNIIVAVFGVIGLLAVNGAAMAPADLVQTIDAHYGAVNAMDVTSDGDILYTGGKDGRIKLWDTLSMDLVEMVPACQVAVNDLVLSPDTTFMVSAGDDGFIKVWDAFTLELLIAIDAHDGGAKALAIDPPHDNDAGGAYIYSGGDDGWVRCWNVEDGYTLEWEQFAHYNGVNDLLLNNSGDYLFSAGVDGEVKVFDALLGSLASEIEAYEEGEVLCLKLNTISTGEQPCLYTGGTNGEIRVWDSATGSLVRTIRAHAGDVNYIDFFDDGMMAISGGEDGKIKLWNSDGELAGEMQAHVLAVRDFMVVNDKLYTGGADYKLRVWDTNF